MKVIEIIGSKIWRNKNTGAVASIFGAVPWTNPEDKRSWVIETRGFTWRLDNGTVGLGRVPAKTYEEARKVMNRINERSS